MEVLTKIKTWGYMWLTHRNFTGKYSAVSGFQCGLTADSLLHMFQQAFLMY